MAVGYSTAILVRLNQNCLLGFLAEAALLGAGGSIGNQQQGADDAGAMDVHQGGNCTLGEDQVDGFSIDEDIQNGGDDDPGNDVADDLDDVEGEDIFPA